MKDLKSIVKNAKTSGDWWGIREYREKTQFRSSRNAKLDRNSTSIDHGLMVEVMIDGMLGYAGTSDFSPAGVSKAFERARDLATSAKKYNIYPFDDRIRPANQGSYKSQFESGISQLGPREIQEFLIATTTELSKADYVFESSAWAMLTETDINYISSNGSDWQQQFNFVTYDASATGQKGDIIQRRGIGAHPLQVGAEFINRNDYRNQNQRILSQLSELLNAPECPSDKRDLILTPDQLYLQVHESIGHPLELDRILGDERNYAGWSFISAEDFGSLRYGSDILNVTYDPTFAGEMASFAYDDNGVEAKKEYLIQDGILKRGIGGIESQKRSGVPGVSTARATSWNRAPIDRMGNINIEPGSSTMEDMISSTERGILMETNNSWSIDDYRNKFQFGCQYGRLIEDGELKGVVKNPNYRGQTVSFWNNLSHVGNKDTFEVWGSPYCGKGEPNQVIRVGHAIPTCKFNDIEVFGGM